jgi:hypothetical protein
MSWHWDRGWIPVAAARGADCRFVVGGPGSPLFGRLREAYHADPARFGAVRQLPSGRYQVRYRTVDGRSVTVPMTFEAKADAGRYLSRSRPTRFAVSGPTRALAARPSGSGLTAGWTAR